jgi:hypothetical protein
VPPVDFGELVEQAEATSVAERKTVEKACVHFMEPPVTYKGERLGKKGHSCHDYMCQNNCDSPTVRRIGVDEAIIV